MNDAGERQNKPGKLYICATPIGNLEDITLRVLRVLQEVDFIAAEDTRHSLKLLNHYNIKTPLTSYFEHNKDKKGDYIAAKILAGENAALITDAGMPGISDPGEELIRLCREKCIGVEICPGATAGVSALVLSGLPSGKYAFEGFPPRGKKERAKYLDKLKTEERTIVFYESPQRLEELLKAMLEAFGDRECALVREITKKYEETVVSAISNHLNRMEETPPLGEFVIIVRGAEKSKHKAENHSKENIIDLVEEYREVGHSPMDAVKAAAKELGLSKREVYTLINVTKTHNITNADRG